jgi:hypothetical protein
MQQGAFIVQQALPFLQHFFCAVVTANKTEPVNNKAITLKITFFIFYLLNI